MDYTFDFQTYIMCEFYRNTSAKSDYKRYNFNDWMQLLSAETKSITRDQVYLFVQHPLTDLINIGTSYIISLSDNSSAFIPMVTYNEGRLMLVIWVMGGYLERGSISKPRITLICAN